MIGALLLTTSAEEWHAKIAESEFLTGTSEFPTRAVTSHSAEPLHRNHSEGRRGGAGRGGAGGTARRGVVTASQSFRGARPLSENIVYRAYGEFLERRGVLIRNSHIILLIASLRPEEQRNARRWV